MLKDLNGDLQYLSDINAAIWPQYNEMTKPSMDHHMAKLLEECGELAAEFSKYWGRQLDPEKTSSMEKIESEWGDCLSTLLVIASASKLDVNSAIKRTIEKIQTKARARIERISREKFPHLCYRCNGQVLVNGTCPNCSVYTG